MDSLYQFTGSVIQVHAINFLDHLIISLIPRKAGGIWPIISIQNKD